MALPMTACNFNRPIPEGIIDLDDPNYCSSSADQQPAYKMIDYELWTKSPAEFVTTGYSCMQWTKEKKIVGGFFLSI